MQRRTGPGQEPSEPVHDLEASRPTAPSSHSPVRGEGGREGGRKGGREGGRKGGREGGREGKSEGGREGKREGERE